MRLSEAIRLGSLAIQNPQAGNSDTCAIGMAAISIGRLASGTAFLSDGDENLVAVVRQWPWCGEGCSPWQVGGVDMITYKPTKIGRIAILFDARVMTGEITLEALCDQVRAWEDELESRGINVEQVTMAAELPMSNHPKFTQGADSAVSGERETMAKEIR